MDVDSGITNSHTLTGLVNGETYTISIASKSSSPGVLPSVPVSAATVGLGRSYIETGSVNSYRHYHVDQFLSNKGRT